ncbi:hypothetical protein, conserved [Eimeria brunetti]|uniref:Protein kinase domain-containing protein n=1 Tax=Eimeria brunetti TaxID=51314 RepID=U6LBI2_9EIME|nr:hypothetical protein, conserved [Eimeria brunetti]
MADSEGSSLLQQQREAAAAAAAAAAARAAGAAAGEDGGEGAAYSIRRNGEAAATAAAAAAAAEGENPLLGATAKARGRGGQPHVGALLGVIAAGVAAAVLSALLLVPASRQQLQQQLQQLQQLQQQHQEQQEQQQQQQQQQELAAAWAEVEQQDEFRTLKSLAAAEEDAPPYLKDGKKELANIIGNRKEHPFPRPGSLGQDVLGALGGALSNDKRSSLIGAVIKLQQQQQLGSDEVSIHPKEYIVEKYLFEDPWSVFVEVKEKKTEKVMMMRIQTLPPVIEGETITAAAAAALQQQSTAEATTAMIQAAGRTPLQQAAAERGLALAAAVATIDKLPAAVRCSRVYALSQVQLLERFYGTFEEVIGGQQLLPHQQQQQQQQRKPLTMHAKLYAAQRLLQQVLLLHSAGLSHNNIKLQNLYMRQDGSFALADFDASTKIGAPLLNVRGVTPRFADKELAVAARGGTLPPAAAADAAAEAEAATAAAAAEAEEGDEEEGAPIVDRRADMWSLGLSLFRIFTGGALPYGLDRGAPAADLLLLLEAEGVRGQQLVGPLTAAGVPHRWLRLMVELLEPQRQHRIDAARIINEYSDLIHIK